MITCKAAVSRLWEYLDQNLGRVSEGELEEHLGLCRHCCGELEFAKQLRGVLGHESRDGELPAASRTRLEAFVKGLTKTTARRKHR